jgi:aminoacylase
LLLNAHTDVVPAVKEKWNTDAFAAHKDENGNIYARGTQDMKCVAVQYLVAVRSLIESGFKPLRNVHLTFVPDEEIGGTHGMCAFVHTQLFKSLNVGFAMDEGLANPTNKFTVFYAERAPFWIMIKSTGPTGHGKLIYCNHLNRILMFSFLGSRFIENTAVERLMKAVRQMLDFREEQFQKLKHNCQCGMKLGDVITLNLTVLKAGVTLDGGKSFSLNVC